MCTERDSNRYFESLNIPGFLVNLHNIKLSRFGAVEVNPIEANHGQGLVSTASDVLGVLKSQVKFV